jgi:hypothetical protein
LHDGDRSPVALKQFWHSRLNFANVPGDQA